MAKLSTNLGLVGGIIAIVLGILLIVGVLSLEIILGIALIVVGSLAVLART